MRRLVNQFKILDAEDLIGGQLQIIKSASQIVEENNFKIDFKSV